MKLLLATLHARYSHSSLALPYLAAVCSDIEGVETVIREYTINEPAEQLLRRLVAEQSDIVAFSCYIWNIEQTLQLVSDLKQIQPTIFVILGGPEVSYNPDDILRKNEAVDCIVRGEGEETFRAVVAALHEHGTDASNLRSFSGGIAFRTGSEMVVTPLGEPVRNLDSIPSPFDAGLVAMEKPLIYYETSRGCPFSCAFCMSSIDSGVRSFSRERIEQDLLSLIGNNAGTVKLVDRTFNYNASRANEIWDFILRHNRGSCFHFEIAADLLTEDNLLLLEKVPTGMFRFEIGVQSGARETLEKVSRKTDLAKLYRNVERLTRRTGVTVHLDLIAGLPDEDYTGFLTSLQRLFPLHPAHIQVEPLKVLHGSPMREIAQREGYAFSGHPPYKILRTPQLAYREICRIETIARLLDVYFNSSKFHTTFEALAQREELSRFFDRMAVFADNSGMALTLSQRGYFDFFWSFVQDHYPEDMRETLRDTLVYDFCCCENPAGGLVPSFFDKGEERLPNRKPDLKNGELLERYNITPGSKVRTFFRHFHKDYTRSPWGISQTGILFIYISSAGKGLQIKSLAVAET